MTLTNTEMKGIVDNLLVDDHISTTCTELVPTCYKLFYSQDIMDVTFTLLQTEYTIPNLAKNTGVTPLEGIVDPENSVIGIFGQIYYNNNNKKIFFKSTEEESMTGWVMLFQFVASPTDDEVMDNITDLLTSAEDAVTSYYNMFYISTPMDVTFKFYDKDTKQLVTKTVPNCAKSKKIGMSGEGSPEGSISATLGTIYVDTIDTDAVYVKTTSSGLTGWYKLLNYSSLVAHNIATDAHQGYLARLHGDEDQYFSAKDPVADTHAVTMGYTGSLRLLDTTDKSSFVGAINEIEGKYEKLVNKFAACTSQPYSMISGPLNSSGDAYIILSPTDTAEFYEDVTAEMFVDNTNNGKWYSTKGTEDNYYYWGNQGLVFGGELGEGFYGWSYLNDTAYGATTDNVGQAGTPIVHTFETPLEAGTYLFAVSSNGYDYTLSVKYDGADHNVTIPSSVSATSWSYTSEFTVTTGLTSISAVSTLNTGAWGIGSIHLLRKLSTGAHTDKVYFRSGPRYDSVIGASIDGVAIEQPALTSINLADVADGNYLVMYNASGYNRHIYDVAGNTVISDEGEASGFNTYSKVSVTQAISNTSFDITLEHKTPASVPEDGARSDVDALIWSALTDKVLKVSEFDTYDTSAEAYHRYLRVSYGNGTTWTVNNWNLCEITGSTNYEIRLVLASGTLSVYLDGELIGSKSSVTVGTITGLNIGSDLTNYTDGVIYLPTLVIKSGGLTVKDGSSLTPYLSSGAFYCQKTEPTASTGVIWKDVSVSPMKVKKYDGSTWRDYEDIPIGSVTVASHAITAASTRAYCNRWVNTPTSVSPAYITDVSGSGTNYNRYWSNGMREQSGQVTLTSTSAQTVTMSSSFSSTNYCLVATANTGTVTLSRTAVNKFTVTGTSGAVVTWRAVGFV